MCQSIRNVSTHTPLPPPPPRDTLMMRSNLLKSSHSLIPCPLKTPQFTQTEMIKIPVHSALPKTNPLQIRHLCTQRSTGLVVRKIVKCLRDVEGSN